jgi:hypothetical protein
VALSNELLSSKAVALIGGLLVRDSKRRLGNPEARQNGWTLKTHPFWWPQFQEASGWDQLLRREIDPPFLPTCTASSSASSASAWASAASESSEPHQSQLGVALRANFTVSQRQQALDSAVRNNGSGGEVSSSYSSSSAAATAAAGLAAAFTGFVNCPGAKLTIAKDRQPRA